MTGHRCGAATTARVRNGRVATQDGPIAETKEVRGGFGLVDARDKVEAVAPATGIPTAHYGSVEVRSILVLQASHGGGG